MTAAIGISRPASFLSGKEAREKNIDFLENCGLLLIWSILILNEGSVRFISSMPSALNREDALPPYLLFIASLLEILYGIIGVFIAINGFLLKNYSTRLTKISMIIQLIFGSFVFVTFTIAVPSSQISKLSEPLFEGLSLGQSRFLIVLGMLTSTHFHIAIQGGQYVLLGRLVSSASVEYFYNHNHGKKNKVQFWNANLCLSGVWTVIVGLVVYTAKMGNNRVLQGSFEVSPHYGTLPEFSVVTGLLMLIWGLVGIGVAKSRTAPPPYLIGCAVVFAMVYLNFGLVQLGTFADGSYGGVLATNASFALMVLFLPIYFIVQCSEADDSCPLAISSLV